MRRVVGPDLLDYANGEVIGTATWGELYKKLEALRLRSFISLFYCFVAVAGALYLFFSRQVLFAAIAMIFAAYYYRSYTGVYFVYQGTVGGRKVLIPNLKVKS